MRRRSLLWVAPGIAYLFFCFWYTDLSGPLTKAEIDGYTTALAQGGGAPDRIARIRRFLEADNGRQFIMVNMLDMATAPPAVRGAPSDATADDLMDRYMQHMYPELFRRACHPVFVGDAAFDALDIVGIDNAEHWSRTALMRYRSRRDMIEIATNPAFGGRHEFKLAALEKTIAYPVETVLYLSDPRVLLLVLLLAIVAVTDIACYGRAREQR
jgi:hypothetical protein